MRRKIFFSAGLIFFVVLHILFHEGTAISQTSELRAGIAEIDITPPAGLSMAGYGARKGVSDGVRDPLFVRTLVLADREKTLAFVQFDLIAPFSGEEADAVREAVKSSKGIEQVIFNASHTHSGPAFGGRASDNAAADWLKSSVEKVISGIERAHENLTSAHIGVAFGKAKIGQNRRFVKPDGTVRMIWNGPINFPTYPNDPSVGVIRIDNAKGQPIAILVNYACHPVVFASDNMKYSADYPGAMMKWVKDHTPGNPVCMFVQGALGNINPITNPLPISENAVEKKNELGQVLGKEVVRVSSGIKTHPVPDARLKWIVKEVGLDMRWNKEKMIELAEKRYGEAVVPMLKRRFERDLIAPLSIIVLEDEFGICGFPGEFFIEFQIDLRNRFTDFPLFFAGYTGTSLGYFPTIRAAVEGGYGANSTTTMVEVGAGERLVDETIIQLKYLTGKLTREMARN